MHILILILALALQIFLTLKKMAPFLSLLIVSVLAGICMGMEPAALFKSVETGAGSTLGGTVFIFCLGAALGKVLEKNGAIYAIAQALIRIAGKKYISWAVMLAAFITGIPLFYNAGFILLLPLIFSLAKETGLPRLSIAIPMAAALSITHCFLPPHPGPVLLVKALHADMGTTLLYGLLIAIPAVITAGPLLAGIIRKLKVEPMDLQEHQTQSAQTPPVLLSFLMALLPVLLIGVSVSLPADATTDTFFARILRFTGEPVIALLIALLIALSYTGFRQHQSMKALMQWIQEAMGGIVMILLIITSGGVLKQVITDSGTAKEIADQIGHWHLNPLVYAWTVTAILRVMLGSATVAAMAAAGLVTPLLVSGYAHPELLVLAIGAGSVFGSHVNDSGFWMFKEFFKLNLKQTFLSWTVMESVISVMGLAGVLVLASVRS